MNLISKSAIALTALGGVGLTGAYVGGLFNKLPSQQTTIIKTTFKNKLEAEGFKVLDANQGGDDWNSILEVYKTATERSFTGTREENKPENELRDNCRVALGKTVEENSNYLEDNHYKRAMQWCVKKETMDAVLKRSGLKMLNFDATSNTADYGPLQEKLNKLKENENKGFNSLKALASTTIGSSNEVSATNFKKGCEALKVFETTDDKFLDNLHLAKDFCYIK